MENYGNRQLNMPNWDLEEYDDGRVQKDKDRLVEFDFMHKIFKKTFVIPSWIIFFREWGNSLKLS